MMDVKRLKAPFPYFGGKSKVAPIIWEHFGNVKNYAEPFFGSGAVLLGRPWSGDKSRCDKSRVETVNDAYGLLVNFWRAVKADPDAVIEWSDYPVSEIDLKARHHWLRERRTALAAELSADPDYFDPKMAGWWLWGKCGSIGGTWESKSGPGIPDLTSNGCGIFSMSFDKNNLRVISKRLRRTRITCGDWKRILTTDRTLRPSGGITGIFLDPPYDANRSMGVYGENDSASVFADVAAWCIEHGPDKNLRIALCGYEGAFEPPPGWTLHQWKTGGGYANQGPGENLNASRERIWFSPACLGPAQRGLF